ncbi:MAG: ATP-binding cassette domain-containing protein [Acidimicrobiales bacterium]
MAAKSGLSTSAAGPVVAFDDLTKRFGSKLAVDRLSFEALPGRVTGLLGGNGSGKTTALRALLGFVRPSAGRATFDGRRYDELVDPTRKVGAVVDQSTFHPARSGSAHLRVMALAAGVAATRVADVLDEVGLPDAGMQRVSRYSLGMRQRLGLAAALLGEPSALILDEPANGLDPQGIRWLRDLLRRAASEGATVLVSSHVLSEVAEVADDVVVVDSGRLVESGPLSGLLAKLGAGLQVRSPQVDRLADLMRERGFRVRRENGDILVIGQVVPDVVMAVAGQHAVPIVEMTPRPRTLEDLFFELTSTEGREPRG